jgi:hypothetical protein
MILIIGTDVIWIQKSRYECCKLAIHKWQMKREHKHLLYLEKYQDKPEWDSKTRRTVMAWAHWIPSAATRWESNFSAHLLPSFLSTADDFDRYFSQVQQIV